jgi:hypothetical protein
MPPKIIVQNYEECLHAFASAADTNLILQNPPYSIHSLGLLYFKQMLEEAAIRYPHVRYNFICDCADDAITVQEALRMGFKTVAYSGAPEIAVKLEDIARQYGAELIR